MIKLDAVKILHDVNKVLKYALKCSKALYEIQKAMKSLQDLNSKRVSFICPKCSKYTVVWKDNPFDGICYHCTTPYMEIFFSGQKLFKVEDTYMTWYVAAANKEEAKALVVEYEGNFDVATENDWLEEEPDIYALSQEEAETYTYYGYNTNTTMWEKFFNNQSSRVIACSEW